MKVLFPLLTGRQARPVNVWRTGWLPFLLLLLLAGRTFALDPSRDLLQYNCQNWSRQSGVSVGSINTIKQTPDGYLWFGSSAGLVRFDGTKFTLFDLHSVDTVRNTIVTSLSVANASGLWVGLENNAYGYFDGRSFSFLGSTNAGTARLDVRSIFEDRNQTVWLATESDVSRVNRDGSLVPVITAGSDTNASLNVTCSYEDRQGRLWFGTVNQGVYCRQADSITKLPDPALDATIVLCIAEDRDGQIWVGTSLGLYCYDAQLRGTGLPRLTDQIQALLVDRHGVLWIGTSGHGLGRYQHARYDFLQKADGLGSDYVNALAEDSEGNVWVGTRNGISQISDVKFPIQPASENPAIKDANAVALSAHGGVWISSGGGVTRFDPATKTYATIAGLTNRFCKRVLEARNGDLYVVTGIHHLSVYSGGEMVANHAAPNQIVALVEDQEGVVAAVGSELYRVGTNYFRPYPFNHDEKPVFYWLLNLASGRDGVIWVASGNGIFRIKDGAYQQWSTAEGLADRVILSVSEDQDGVVWAGLLSGIARLKDNHISLIKRTNGLFDENIYAIIPDDLGNLWVDSGRGIFRVSRQEMNDFADGKTDHVTSTVYDGLDCVKVADKTLQLQERVGVKTADGRLWFPSPLGVVTIDPANIPANRVAPPVHIDHVSANGREMEPGNLIVVPPGRGEIEFQYHGLSFIAPQKMQFRYRLKGYDNTWVEADGRQLAFYTNLKPGRYTFRVTAANADGIWNEAGDTVTVELRPFFYQTIWFKLLGGGLAVAALLGLYLWRVRHLTLKQRTMQKARELLEAEVQARTVALAKTNESLQQKVAEHKLAEEKLAHEQARLLFVFESMPVGVSLSRKHSDGRFERIINETHLRICGLTREQDQEPGIYLKITHPEDAARQAELGRELDAGRPGQLTMEKRYVRPDGQVVWVVFSFQRHVGEDGSVEELTTALDITERKQAEASLTEASALLLTLLENMTDHIYFKDRESRFVHFSREMLKLFHLTRPEELKGKTDFDFFSEEHARMAFETEQEIIRTGQPVLNLEEKETHKDGRITWGLTSKMPWRDKAGNIIGTMGISRDITERKRLEIQLFQAQKMETVGKLAGGIAHEFNSILTAIICQSDMLQIDVPPGSPVAEGANEINKAAVRAAALTRQLLAYGRKQMLWPKNLNLNQILTGMDNMLRHLMGAEISVSIVPASDRPMVKVDAGQIEQVVVNLAMNARDAMPNGGTLTLETANVRFDEDSVGRHSEMKPGNYVMLAISDTGRGMSEAVKARAFEPFFTTKDIGQGTGLGLSTCYGILKQSGGHINLYSELGRGTTFKLYLPQVESPEKSGGRDPGTPNLPRGTETVLLVEDEPALRDTTAMMLRRLGYEVLVAANGVEALSLTHQPNNGHIDLLFTDVVMPHMSGRELADRMRMLYPRTRILFTSAYTEQALAQQGGLDEGIALLQKPFTPSLLALKIREMLDKT